MIVEDHCHFPFYEYPPQPGDEGNAPTRVSAEVLCIVPHSLSSYLLNALSSPPPWLMLPIGFPAAVSCFLPVIMSQYTGIRQLSSISFFFPETRGGYKELKLGNLKNYGKFSEAFQALYQSTRGIPERNLFILLQSYIFKMLVLICFNRIIGREIIAYTGHYLHSFRANPYINASPKTIYAKTKAILLLWPECFRQFFAFLKFLIK